MPANNQTYSAQDNANARLAILNSSVNMLQQISAQSFAATDLAGQVINIPVRNVGLIKRFIVKVEATVARTASETQTRTAYGPANILSNVIFTDLANQTRINTSGWHLHNVASASPRRNMKAYGAAFTNDSPVDFGSNFTVMSAPATFTTGNQSLVMYYEIPVTYSDFDLRGAVFASVVNATMNLQLTLNSNFFVGSTTNSVLSVYQSSTAGDLGVISAMTVTVYQEYLDQLPMAQGGPVLPLFDLATALLLNNTVATGLAANQDLAIPYANFRDFMSTWAIYDNAGVLNNGSDVAHWSIQSANYTNIVKYDPVTSALLTREVLNDDPPLGTYYFNHRRKPINTIQYGNMQLILNPSAVTATAQVLVGYEALALINQVAQAGSLYNT